MADGKLLYGQQYDPKTEFTVPFTEIVKEDQDAQALVGTARTEIVPMDGHASRVRTYTSPSAQIEAFFLRTPGRVSINLPNVLTALTVTYNFTTGDGESIHDAGVAVAFGQSGGLNFNPNASAQGSAAIVPDLQPTISEPNGEDIPTIELAFYIAGDSVTETELIARIEVILTIAVTSVVAGVVTTSEAHNLTANQPFTFPTVVGGSGGITAGTVYFVKTTPTTTTFTYAATAGGATIVGHAATSGTMAPKVYPWPQWRPEAVNFTLKGEQISISVSAESRHMDRWSLTDGTLTQVSYAIEPVPGGRSDGNSREVGLTTRSVRIPPTIHGLLTISNPTQNASCTVTALANIPVIMGIGGAPAFSPVFNGPHELTENATGSVTPTSVAATSGATSIPTYGLYLYRPQIEQALYGYNRAFVVLVNFNHFA